jgi:hypothetical protein
VILPALMEHPEQPRLRGLRQLRNLVEKQGDGVVGGGRLGIGGGLGWWEGTTGRNGRASWRQGVRMRGVLNHSDIRKGSGGQCSRSPLTSLRVGSPVLYSTNPFLKLHIQEKYRQDLHYVWCSESFDSSKAPAYATAMRLAPSSDPSRIYADLKAAVGGGDTHCAKIAAQRASLMKLAAGWRKRGEISDADKEDIVYLAKNSALVEWRPLIYVIPRAPVEARLLPVPAKKRAGVGSEFILDETLRRDEFDIIEL